MILLKEAVKNYSSGIAIAIYSRSKEGRRKKEEGKVLRCLSFKLLTCPNLYFDCYNLQRFSCTVDHSRGVSGALR
ncbi:hypothetical protein [Okeania sp. KiyG1]|uniref:hypothetical protein n=1 Tax=Okeania sp. KiyG1 TaxID=2720165 RepID=UPI001F294464|nr:hypothetical protein [Okeania sp. KiyG1]